MNDPNGGIKNTSSIDSLLRVAITVWNNPLAILTLFGGGLGTRMSMNNWQVPGIDDLTHYTVGFLFVVASVYFLVSALPKTYHIFVTAACCGILSLLSMSWCLNNETSCRSYYVVTAERSRQIYTAFGEFTNKILGN